MRGVVLVGARGSGKTSVGRCLAARVGLPFLDTDGVVERETGLPVAALLATGRFRAEERRVLAERLAGPPVVLATGGGAVLWDGFLAAAAGWRVVWLDAGVRVLASRIAAEPGTRPSLTGRPPAEEIAELAAERAPLYAAAAWRRVRTDASDPETVAALIEQLLCEDGQTPERAASD